MGKILLPPFLNVGPGLVASLPNLPQGYVYDGIALQLGGGLTKGDIEQIHVRLGGILIWEFAQGSDLDAINQYYKRAPAATVLPCWFATPLVGADQATMYTGAIDTMSHHFSAFQMTVTLAAGAPAGSPITAFGVVRSAPQPKGVESLIRAFLLSEQSVQAAQQYTLDFPKGSAGGALLCAIHVFNTEVTQIQLLRDSQELVEKGNVAIVQYFQNEETRNTQAGLVSYDAMERNDIVDAVPTLNAKGKPANFQFKVTFGAADNIRLYSELILNPAHI